MSRLLIGLSHTFPDSLIPPFTAVISAMSSSSSYRLLVISTAVAPLGSGLGGGVELFVKNAVQGL